MTIFFYLLAEIVVEYMRRIRRNECNDCATSSFRFHQASSGHENSVFFGPVTLSRITTSETSILSQAKSLTVRSSLKYFPGHQRMATNSMHLHFSYILYLQRLSNCKRIWTQCSVCSGAFLWKQSMSYGCWLVWWIALSWLFGKILNTILPNNLL